MEASAIARWRWLGTLAVIGVAGFALIWWWRTTPSSDPTALLPAPVPQATLAPTVASIVGEPEIGVDVVGAVQHPDLYYLPEGARVADAVELAGGFAPDADRDAVNLAARLKDEQQLRIPRVGESQAVARDVEPTVVATESGLIDLNRADSTVLETLPGIGPTIAGRIIAYRTEHGPFRSVDQLDEVGGIGAETLAELRSLVTVTP